jgi:hypothetical protein
MIVNRLNLFYNPHVAEKTSTIVFFLTHPMPRKYTLAITEVNYLSIRWCNENKLPFGWQSRFHDHIMQDGDEFNRIRNYIIDNPANWNDEIPSSNVYP